MPDNTGIRFNSRARHNAREANKFLQQYFRDPKLFVCSTCGSNTWIIFADDDPRSGMIMIQCANDRCRATVPPCEMRKPQMNDDIARKTGLVLPDPYLSDEPPGRPIDIRKYIDAGDDSQN